MRGTFSATSYGVSFIAQLGVHPNRQSKTEVWCISCVLQIRTRLIRWALCGEPSELFQRLISACATWSVWATMRARAWEVGHELSCNPCCCRN
jgi:hypothetical protein